MSKRAPARSADRRRRQSQRQGVQSILSRKTWVSLKDFTGVKGTDSSISARIRELRKQGRKVECRRHEDGVYRYRLVR